MIIKDSGILNNIKEELKEDFEASLEEGDFWVGIDFNEYKHGLFCHVMVDDEYNEDLFEVTSYKNILDDEGKITSDYSNTETKFYIDNNQNIFKKGYLEVSSCDFNGEKIEEGEFGLEIGIYDSNKCIKEAIELTFFQTKEGRDKYIEYLKSNTGEQLINIEDYFSELYLEKSIDDLKKEIGDYSKNIDKKLTPTL